MADFHDSQDPNTITWTDFERDLRALGRSERTLQSYRESAEQLAGHWTGADLLTLGKSQVLDYLIAVRRQHSGATELVRYRSLHRYFAWAVAEGFLERSPLAGVPLPRISQKVVPVPAQEVLRALLAACQGTDFDQVRDTAVIRVLAECGLRLSELAGLTVADVDMGPLSQVRVTGKGDKERYVPFSNRTGKALTRYLRARQHHDQAALDGFWLGSRGQALTPNGVAQVLRRRSRQAGVSPAIRPHQLRHYAASEKFRAGLSDQASMRIFGWVTLAMPHHYGAHTGAQRAIDADRLLAIGDKL